MSEGKASSDDQPKVAQGWYPDPKGSGDLFYWDGSKWTGAVRQAADPKRSRSSGPRIEAPQALVIVGGAVLAISPFLTWVKVFLLGNLSLFQLLEVAGRSKTLAWVAVLAGVGAATVAFADRRPTTTRVVGSVVGLLGGALAILALIGLRHDVRETYGLAAIDLGAYIALGGCGAMVVGAVLAGSSGSRRRTR